MLNRELNPGRVKTLLKYAAFGLFAGTSSFAIVVFFQLAFSTLLVPRPILDYVFYPAKAVVDFLSMNQYVTENPEDASIAEMALVFLCATFVQGLAFAAASVGIGSVRELLFRRTAAPIPKEK